MLAPAGPESYQFWHADRPAKSPINIVAFTTIFLLYESANRDFAHRRVIRSVVVRVSVKSRKSFADTILRRGC